MIRGEYRSPTISNNIPRLYHGVHTFQGSQPEGRLSSEGGDSRWRVVVWCKVDQGSQDTCGEVSSLGHRHCHDRAPGLSLGTSAGV